MNITFDSSLLDMDLKPTHINLFLQLVKVSEIGAIQISVTDIMELIKCRNRKQTIDYLRVLEEKNLIKINSINGSTNIYELNQNFYNK